MYVGISNTHALTLRATLIPGAWVFPTPVVGQHFFPILTFVVFAAVHDVVGGVSIRHDRSRGEAYQGQHVRLTGTHGGFLGS